MRSQGGFSVAWEQYGSVMCAGFQELQQRAEFVDMTIAADGHLVRVHQMVVGLASPFLKELLRSAPSPNPVLFLNNISHKILCCVLEYMYTGEALVPADDLKTFIATGKALRVRGLEDMMVPEPVVNAPEEHEVVDAAATLVHEASSNTQTATITERPASIKLHAQKHVNITEVNKARSCNNIEPETSHHTLHIPGKKRLNLQMMNNSDMADFSSVPAKIRKEAKTVEVISDDEGAEHWTNDADDNYNEEYEIQHEDDKFQVNSTLEEQGSKIKEVDRKKRRKEVEGSRVKKAELMFTVSNQGARQLILNRYLYTFRNNYKDGRIRWECIERRCRKCQAIAVTKDNALLARYSAHNHQFHDKKIMAKVKKNCVFTSIEQAECGDKKSTD